MDDHGIQIHDADKIGSVVSEDDVPHLFEGEKDSSTVPPSKLSGWRKAIKRHFDENTKKTRKASLELMKPKPKVDWDLKKQV